MTFSLKAKKELCKMNVKKDCCKRALLYGILLFAVNFEIGRIRLITESEDTGVLLTDLLLRLYHIDANVYVTEKKQKDDDGEIQKSHKITVSAKADTIKLFEKFGITDDSRDIINKNLFICENCLNSFLRGAFLSAGRINNPNAENRLEIVVKNPNSALELLKCMETAGVLAKLSSRSGTSLVYIKSSEQIEMFLAQIGASSALFDMMNIRILKEAKNDANRQLNCDTANLNRIVSAAGIQTDAIKWLIESGKISLLSDELEATARLRLEYSELSIKDFGQVFEPPISKSGINHRLKKIVDFANENGFLSKKS